MGDVIKDAGGVPVGTRPLNNEATLAELAPGSLNEFCDGLNEF